MIITCKACNASFNLDESLLKPEGSKVRCSKCKEIFMAYPPVPPEEAEQPDEMISDVELDQEAEDDETGRLDDSGAGEPDVPEMDAMLSKEEIPEKEDDAGEAIEDFKLDLDLEPEPEKPSEEVEMEAKLEEPDKLDLSEMEDLLDETQVLEKESDVDEAIGDLELELEPEPEKPSEDVKMEAEPEEPDELDLSDIEELIDLDDPVTEEKDMAEPEDIELELDMEIEPDIEKAPEDMEASVETEELEEVDLSDIEKMFEAEEEETEKEAEPVDSALPEETLETELDEMEATADQPETADFSEPEEIDQKFAIEDTDQEDLPEEEIAHV
ncbi:MAG: zinc-ribbon domain-containing protein, partial [Desulfobacterales bacterium]